MVRVLVVGAGPTGLTAAVELARRGHQPTVIEAREGPSRLSRAVGISRRSIELLEPCGAAGPIVEEAILFTGLRMHRGTRLIGTIPLNFDDRSRLYGLPQDRTEEHLRAALARYDGSVRYGVRLTGFVADDEGVTAEFGGVSERFNYLIGADGARSTVRETLGLAFRGYELGGVWSIADVTSPTWPYPTEFSGYLLPHGEVVVVVPMAPARFRVVASTPDALAALPVELDVAELHRSGSFTISVRQVDRYKVGRVLLAGDAAHCHSPVGGRGMNLGIADAADLAERLTGGHLDSYSQARHGAGAEVIEFSERGRRQLQTRNPVRKALSRAALRLAGRVPRLGEAAAHRFVSG